MQATQVQAQTSLAATRDAGNRLLASGKRVQRKLPHQSALLLKLIKTLVSHLRLLAYNRSPTIPVHVDVIDSGDEGAGVDGDEPTILDPGFPMDLATALKGSDDIPVAAQVLLREQAGDFVRLLRIDGRPYLAVCLNVLPDELA